MNTSKFISMSVFSHFSQVKWHKTTASPALKVEEIIGSEEEEVRSAVADVRPGTAIKKGHTLENDQQIKFASAIQLATSTKAAKRLMESKSETMTTVVTKEVPISNAPLKLVNAADPKILDAAVKEAQHLDVSQLPMYYLGLSKSRLTGLVVVTAMAGYALAPAAFAVVPFASLTLGTALTSASANTINQIMEVEFDSQMDRTKNRVLVRNHLRYLNNKSTLIN